MRSGVFSMQNQDIYFKAFHAADIGTCITDKNGLFVEVNNAYCKIYGYKREELIGKHFSMVVPIDNRQTASKLHDDFFTSENEIPQEWLVQRKDGRLLNIFVSAGLIVSDNQERYKVTKVTDISDLKSKEQLILRMGRIIDQVNHEIFMVEPDNFQIIQANKGARENLQYSEHELKKMYPWDLTPEVSRSHYISHLNALIDKKQKWISFETSHCRKDQTTYPVEIKIQYVSSDLSNIFIFIVQDISERKAILSQLIQNEIQLKEAQKLARIGSWNWDIVSHKISWSDETYRIFGLDPNKISIDYQKYISMIHPEDRKKLRHAIDQTLKYGHKYSVEHRIVMGDGTIRYVHGLGDIEYDHQGNPFRMFGTVRDLTKEKQTQKSLKTFNALLEQSIHIIFITAPDGTIVFVNPTFEKLTGYVSDEIIGQKSDILISTETEREVLQSMWETVDSGKTWQGVIKNKKKNGQIFWANVLITPIHDESNEIINHLSIHEDITRQMQSIEKAQYLESFDRVTGLFNRSCFIDTLAQKLASSDNLSMLLIQLSDYKLINDAYGVNFTDNYLRAVIQLIQKICQSYSTPQAMGRVSEATLGFVFDLDNIQTLIDMIPDLMHQVSTYGFSKNSVSTSLAIGIVCQKDTDRSSDDFVRKAFIALNIAKKRGRNTWHLFHGVDLQDNSVSSLFKQKEWILPALNEDRFEPWFQPILDLKDNEIHHYEALARMRDLNGNIILPGAFIPAAEQLGLIGDIDKIIAKKTIDCQKELDREGRTLSFSMNISGKNLGDAQLLSFLQETIKTSSADPRGIIFEITETAAINDLKAATQFIKELKNMGCKFSLDDFGVGFTSFIYLRELNVDFIKIDGMFVRNLHEDKEDQSIVKAIAMIAKEMNILTIAEFVETKKTLLMLKQFGIDYAQGYLIGKPSPKVIYK
jgi:PAS domain S-box-containing protein/diguanylate cyclase (GGDEF)-like protein